MNPPVIPRIDASQPDFAARFSDLLHWNRGDLAQIEKAVAKIITEVRAEGDAALIRLTKKFDAVDLTPETLLFSRDEIQSALAGLDPADRRALGTASQRIQTYHQWQMPEMGVSSFQDDTGTQLGQRLTPMGRVGLYVPGGLASYPSSVLMNALPARVAGVSELAMVVPTPRGVVNPLVLAAAAMAGVEEIYRIGGAQAVAALAYGTATIKPVDKIVGPGNIYVATAKRQLFGQVGIDMIAGPSEILVIADSENDPHWLAADLLSQAEHDVSARAMLMTDDPVLADAVEEALRERLPTLERRDICAVSLAKCGAIITVRDLAEACRLASTMAPEHLELAIADPQAALPQIHNAGAIFLGRYTPEAVGDYVAGPNHVLPTGGTARFSSPLGVHDFIKRTSLIGCTPESVAIIGPTAARLAASEGLTAHKRSVDLRLEPRP